MVRNQKGVRGVATLVKWAYHDGRKAHHAAVNPSKGWSSSTKKFHTEYQRWCQYGANLLRCRDEKWFNIDPARRSIFGAPQDIVVDGMNGRKVVQTVE
jgi:hypothetical protein